MPIGVCIATLHTYTRGSATVEIALVGSRYAVQGHSRSLILVQLKTRMQLSISE